jgi:hypothetical protein
MTFKAKTYIKDYDYKGGVSVHQGNIGYSRVSMIFGQNSHKKRRLKQGLAGLYEMTSL